MQGEDASSNWTTEQVTKLNEVLDELGSDLEDIAGVGKEED
jgi:hypothetical protein